MRSSTAFDEIVDPHDPAWGGHADVDDAPRRRTWIAGVVVVVAIVAASVFALLTTREPSAGGDTRSTSPKRTILPAVAPSTGAELPVAPVEEVEPTGDPLAATAPTGSGWAPKVATQPSWSSRWLEGDLAGVSPAVTSRLEAVAKQLDRKIEVISGWRTTHEQTDLYRRYQAGTGNLAAVPGTSMHESGRAADVYVDGVALANVEGASAIAATLGLHFPVGGEPWHVELIG